MEKLSRRGVLGWLGALVGAGAVAKVAPAEAESIRVGARNACVHSNWQPRDKTCMEGDCGRFWSAPIDARPIQEMLDAHLRNTGERMTGLGPYNFGSYTLPCPGGCADGAGHTPHMYCGGSVAGRADTVEEMERKGLLTNPHDVIDLLLKDPC
jgi:hypothetical protein